MPSISDSDAPNNPADDAQPAALAGVLTDLKKHFGEFPMVPPLNQVIRLATTEYMGTIDPASPPEPTDVETHLLAITNALIRSVEHKAGTRDEKLPLQKSLDPWQVAEAMVQLDNIVRIAPADTDTKREYDILAMYQPSGPDHGTYTSSEEEIRSVMRRYRTMMTGHQAKEIELALREIAPRVNKTQHPDLIAVDNGVVNYSSKDLVATFGSKTFTFKAKSVHPFDPAMVFTSKTATAYVEQPQGLPPVITAPGRDDWDVIEWIQSLSDDEGVPELLWEIIGAVLRPNVSWNKTAWFYSEVGNNGKGTLCALIRNVIGAGAHTALPLSEFGNDFALEPLMKVQAIITDENDVGTFIDQAANLKSVVTGDVININRKYRSQVAYQFRGFMIQCLNEFPRAKDKSDSFYRRQLFVPFSKWFGGGAEKKYIKDEYLQRQEVLEYVLWYAINKAGAETPGEYYELSAPPVTQDVLEEYKETNDPVRFFWESFRRRFVWDLLPFTFLHDAYRSWSPRVNPSGSPVSYKQFVNDLVAVVNDDPMWHCPGKRTRTRPKQMMDAGEPLIAEYDLKHWMNPSYKSTDPLRIGLPELGESYRGLVRSLGVQPGAAPADAADADDTEEVSA